MIEALSIPVEALGLCQHCGIMLSLHMPAEAMDSRWRCPICKEELTHLSFGYDRAGQGAQKVRWVGPNETWVTDRPTEDFNINNVLVIV